MFEAAGAGTIFLDEIGELAYPVQAKLLRAIEYKRVLRVGGNKEIAVDVRVICATNRDLQKAVKTNDFRSDLFFRVATFTINMPPLRERRDDILPLARHFARQLSSTPYFFTPEAEARLLAYDWPGNIRQLRSVIENAMQRASSTTIQSVDLSLPIWQKLSITNAGIPRALADAERQHIISILNQCDNNITLAAKVLDIARSTLVIKLKAYGLSQA
jgi:two-component system response regulator HydG